MALPPSTANWHWKNKNVTRWAKEWFEQQLVGLTVKGDTENAEVKFTGLDDFEGDVELGQRKSKLITIFDVRIGLLWEGTASNGASVTGKVEIPEVSHENTLDGLQEFDYEWNIKTGGPSAEVASFISAIKKNIPSILETKFALFPAAIVEIHGKDLYVGGTPGTVTPTTSSGGASTPAAPATSAAPPKKQTSGITTTTVHVDANFMVSADDLFSLLTDEKRIPAWSRAAAVSQAKAETEYSLFGGGVRGKYVALTPAQQIVQTWSLKSPTWPEGHLATLTTTLTQSSDSTKMELSLSGVPTGTEEDVKRNLEGYYIMGLKSIGLGSVL